ncbi:hypothetical protein L3Q82_000619 [Scortum barcoo]|uniref:Uncharacterized protein n=1 Tax=Scortum barcoo TaxID=214431 RepID=A0ACB8WFE5_9TELE|nr:hypothetical protein L3Q82_000619 [Scortum barcoo]
MTSAIFFRGVSTDSDMHHDFCFRRFHSPKDALEERLLLDSITWPDTPVLPSPFSLEQTSDPAHSTFTILSGRRGGQWHVGDQLEALIKMYDFQGRPKKSGRRRLTGPAAQPNTWCSGFNMKVSIRSSGIASVTVLPKKEDQPEVKSSSVQSGPSGYYYQDAWQSLGGSTVRRFKTSSDISQCLKGKVIHMYGDSTIRQWFEYLSAALPDLKEFDLHSRKQVGPFMALDYANNILVTFRCHGPPIRFVNVPTTELRYIANEIDGINGGTNTVVIFGIWSHFSTFPIEVYVRRLQSICRAVVRLLDRAPGMLVIIRTANLKALTLYETLTVTVGSPPAGKVHEGPVQCGLGNSHGRWPQRPNSWTKTLAIGTWNVTSLGGKEPELVREVERYRLEIVGLTSTHSLGSGTQLLERDWTLHYSGVAQGERRRAGVGLLIAPQFSRHVLEFTPGEREGRFPAPSGWG